ncbi:MAG: hypothetical protein KIT83_16600 [Bryobacterales bacterium]|nr:hypothetical protein [Bryobacterales bacterium]
MAPRQDPANSRQSNSRFHLEGVAELQPGEDRDALELQAIAVGRDGRILGTSPVAKEGKFRIDLALAEPEDVQLFVGPADDPEALRNSSAASRQFVAGDWKKQGEGYSLSASLSVSRLEWVLWLPRKVCVYGRVRKVYTEDGVTRECPVPFTKVEVFDVDREGCYWPYIVRKWTHLNGRRVVRVPDLIDIRPKLPKPPIPDPPPFQFDYVGTFDPGSLVGFNPQPEPPIAMTAGEVGSRIALNPQPLPPRAHMTDAALKASDCGCGGGAPQGMQAASTFAGETASLDPAIAQRLGELTLTSRLEPWILFPRCFYSKRIACVTITNDCGEFRCCFKWYPFHFRNGRLRYDPRPDIIIRLTQVINGVERVIYVDPYTSTRWNYTGAYLTLTVDDEDIKCGSCDPQIRPEGTQVFFTRIGNDEVYRINQGTGTYTTAGLSNMAYGSTLRVHAQFGNALSTGAPARYYRLSYRKGAAPFTPIDASLSDTRVNKVTLQSESHTLGPLTVNGVPGLYEIRNFGSYYWYNPDWIGLWNTLTAETDTGLFTLRLEVFDQNGVKLNAAAVDYRDGTVGPPAVLPPMGDQCDLKITLDNQPPEVEFSVPAAINECGVVPWSPGLVLNFPISAQQENGRLRSWYFLYRKGVNPASTTLASGVSSNGSPGNVAQLVSGAPLLAGLTTTCAFDLELGAWAHVRNGYGLVYFRRQNKAIAVEKCDCPECP